MYYWYTCTHTDCTFSEINLNTGMRPIFHAVQLFGGNPMGLCLRPALITLGRSPWDFQLRQPPVYATLQDSDSMYCKHRAFTTSPVACRLKVGDNATMSKAFSAADMQKFIELSGDDNPIHRDEKYAATTRFGRPIVHGTLTLG